MPQERARIKMRRTEGITAILRAHAEIVRKLRRLITVMTETTVITMWIMIPKASRRMPTRRRPPYPPLLPSRQRIPENIAMGIPMIPKTKAVTASGSFFRGVTGRGGGVAFIRL